jgi:hypothetical protein
MKISTTIGRLSANTNPVINTVPKERDSAPKSYRQVVPDVDSFGFSILLGGQLKRGTTVHPMGEDEIH